MDFVDNFQVLLLQRISMKFNGIIIGTIPFRLQAFALRTFISQYGITEPLFEKCSSDGKSVPYFDSARAKVNRAAILRFLPEIRTRMSKLIQNNRGVQKMGSNKDVIVIVRDI